MQDKESTRKQWKVVNFAHNRVISLHASCTRRRRAETTLILSTNISFSLSFSRLYFASLLRHAAVYALGCFCSFWLIIFHFRVSKQSRRR